MNDITEESLAGVWRSESIKSDWGVNVITLSFSNSGYVVQENYFPEEEETLVRKGRYELSGDKLIMYLEDEGQTIEQSFHVEANSQTLKIFYKEEDTRYVFNKIKPDSPSGVLSRN